MSDLVLSSAQADAQVMVDAFVRQDAVRVAVLTGYAGTGKTTLIRYLRDAKGIEPTVLAPTGKAALRVGEATGLYGMTIHRFLYTASEDARTGRPVFRLKDSWDESFSDMEGSLVLVDEASMVDREVWDDLIRVAIRQRFYLLLMGDLFQLPPVSKDRDGTPFSALNYDTPFKANMTHVIRQALDSPVIRASMLLREGQPEREALKLLTPVGASKLIESSIAIRDRGGATICFTNKRRHLINNEVRARRGYEPNTIMTGEPLLVVQNNYDLNVYNGEIIDFGGWEVEPCEPWAVTDRYSNSSLNLSYGIGSHNNNPFTACPQEICGATDVAGIGGWTIRKTARDWYRNNFADEVSDQIEDQVQHWPSEATHLDAHYGQSLTCHKSQGSEWPEVLIVVEEALGRLIPVERKRWLYTASTRAKETACYIYVKENP